MRRNPDHTEDQGFAFAQPELSLREMDAELDARRREMMKAIHPDRELFTELGVEDVHTDPVFSRYRGYLRKAVSAEPQFADVDSASLQIESLAEVLQRGKQVFTLAQFEEDPFESQDATSPKPLSSLLRVGQSEPFPANIFRASDARSGRAQWYQFDRDFHLQAPLGGVFEVDEGLQMLPFVETVDVGVDSRDFYALYGEHLNVEAVLSAFQTFFREQGKEMKRLAVPKVQHIQTPLFAAQFEDGSTAWFSLELERFQSRWWARHHASPEVQKQLKDQDLHRREQLIEKTSRLSDDGEVELRCTLLDESFPLVVRAHDQGLYIASLAEMNPAQRSMAEHILQRFLNKISQPKNFQQLAPSKKLAYFTRYIARASEEARFAHFAASGKDVMGQERLQILDQSSDALRLWVRGSEQYECQIQKTAQGALQVTFSAGPEQEQLRLKKYFEAVLKRCKGHLGLFAQFMKQPEFTPWALDCGVSVVRSTRTPSGVMRRIQGSQDDFPASQVG